MRMNNCHHFKSLIIGVCRIPILHTDGGTRLVVQIDDQVIAPRFADNLRAVKGVRMQCAADSLTCAVAGGVVGEQACPLGASPAAEAAGLPMAS